MQRRRLVAGLILGALLIVVGLLLFPPWTTEVSGNGFPKVSFRWIGSPPAPVLGCEYFVHVQRLESRVALVLLALVVVVFVTLLLRGRHQPLPAPQEQGKQRHGALLTQTLSKKERKEDA
jgi:hypothetical protein